MQNFSVLLSVYIKEHPDYLRKSLESVFNQTLNPTEVVLVEDGPLTPELYAIIQEFQSQHPELKTYPSSINEGLGKALNRGLDYCSYDLVARMDTDDICKPNRFEKQVKFMEQHPEIGLMSSWLDEFIQEPGDCTQARKVPEYHESIMQYAKSRCPINHPAVIYRKSKVKAVGGYQIKYFPEDYFLWVKMLQNGTKVYNMQESLVWFRFSPETFKRRGGWKYAKDEIITQKNMYKMGFISIPMFIKNVVIRVTTRLLPNSLRGWLYTTFLRK